MKIVFILNAIKLILIYAIALGNLYLIYSEVNKFSEKYLIHLHKFISWQWKTIIFLSSTEKCTFLYQITASNLVQKRYFPYKIETMLFLQLYYILKNNSISANFEMICFDTFIDGFLGKNIDHDIKINTEKNE